MLASTVVDFLCGKTISNPATSQRGRVGALVVSIAANLGLLGFFKYYMFTAENLNRLLDLLGANTFSILQITLPIGISFYTFQSMSYTIDVYRGRAPKVRSFIDFACFVSLFPQLIAGPIVRYNTIAGQLAGRTHNWGKFTSGVSLFILGFSKKILIANPSGAVADAVFAAESAGALEAWFGVTAYAFQIYFDFSGYSDMAIGLARTFGFEFPKNFASPYRAESISEFWRRWHISLSTFLRDYLYIPLGGNRKGAARTYANLLIVMLLGGLWHGAGWTFLVWGAYHGVLLGLERVQGKTTFYAFLPAAARKGITFVLVLISWVVFRSSNLGQAGDFLGAMFSFSPHHGPETLLSAQIFTQANLVLVAIAAGFAFGPTDAEQWASHLSWLKGLAIILLFLMALIVMSTQAFNPFLYFQF